MAAAEETLSVRIDADTLARVDHLAEAEARTRSQMVRLLLIEALRNHARPARGGSAPES